MTKVEEKLSDMEVVIFWVYHIENPCGITVNGKKVNIRDFYIRESRENILPILTNPFAKEYLERVINKYKKDNISKTEENSCWPIEMPREFIL